MEVSLKKYFGPEKDKCKNIPILYECQSTAMKTVNIC